MMLLQTVLTYFLFALAIGVCFYIPGLYLVALCTDFSRGEQHFLAWPVGYSLFILLSYTGGWIHFPLLSLFVALALTLFVLLRKRTLFTFSSLHYNWLLVLVIIIGSAAFTSMSFRSGLLGMHGLQYIGMVNSTDGLMHIAHIKTQTLTFPPPLAAFAGYSMHGYHYFYDFLLSRFVLFFHFSADDLYYRLFPFVVSLFYGASFYFFTKLFTKKTSTLFFVLFFVYFAQSWSFILWLFTKTVDVTNGLGLVQPLEMILDPSAIIAIALLLAGFFMLFCGKETLRKTLLIVLILGPLAQMKVYAGIVAIVTLSAVILYDFIRQRPVKFSLAALFGVGFLTAFTYLPSNMGTGHLYAFPFFLYDIFMRQTQLFSPWNWDMRMGIYQAHHNTVHILFLYIVAFLLFWVLTLGSRIFAVLGIGALLSKKFWLRRENIWYVTALLFPLLVGSLFIQSFSPFSTIQFLWIVGILLAIPVGIFYGKLYEKIPRWGRIALLGFLLFTSLGSFVGNEHIYLFSRPQLLIPPAKLQFVQTLQEKIGTNSYFVVAPTYIFDKNHDRVFQYPAPFFAALTGRITYYEYETPEFSNPLAIAHRKKQVEAITLKFEKCDGRTVGQIMQQTGASYLVTTSDVSCKSLSHMQKLATSGNWVLWKVGEK